MSTEPATLADLLRSLVVGAYATPQGRFSLTDASKDLGVSRAALHSWITNGKRTISAPMLAFVLPKLGADKRTAERARALYASEAMAAPRRTRSDAKGATS